jgi:hypothetical protein
MTTPTVLTFSDQRDGAVAAIDAVGDGRGWCNIAPNVEEDVPDMKVNYFGLRFNKGVTIASYVTAPPRRGVAQPSTLGVLHSRSRLGKERVASMLAGAPFAIRQDHNSRGLLLEVPVATPATQVLSVMCLLTEALCDYDFTGTWTLSKYLA